MIKLHYLYNDKKELIGWQELPLRNDLPVVELTEEEFKQLQDNFERGIFKEVYHKE